MFVNLGPQRASECYVKAGERARATTKHPTGGVPRTPDYDNMLFVYPTYFVDTFLTAKPIWYSGF